MSIMEDIKKLLLEGKSVKEIKELGFKAPSIYKVKKSLKDESGTPPESLEPPEPPVTKEPEKKFQEVKETKEVPKTILDSDNSGHSDPPTNNLDPDSISKEEEIEENLVNDILPETFEDDAVPFREFDEVGIDRDYINISGSPGMDKSSSNPQDQGKGTGQLGVTELLTQVYSIIGVITGHEHWELSSKEQKIVKHLCKIPALEKFLHKFGLYGCVISLITITFKKIKEEIHLKEKYIPNQENKKEIIVRPDAPSNIIDSIGEE